MTPETGFRPGSPAGDRGPVTRWRDHLLTLRVALGTRPLLVAGTLFFLCLAFFLLADAPNQFVDRPVRDALHRWAANRRLPHPDLVVLALDDASLQAVRERWPWSRGRLADLLERLGQHQPRLVVWDFLMNQPEGGDGGDGDARFEQVLRTLGNVILVVSGNEIVRGDEVELQVVTPLARFQAVAEEGLVRGIRDSDGVIRRFVTYDHRLDLPSCALRVLTRLDPARGARLRQEMTATVSRTSLAFARGGGAGGIPVFSVRALLEGEIPAGALAGKIVVVGPSALALHDFHQTPLRTLPGVEILAGSIDTLLTGRQSQMFDTVGWRLAVGLLGLIFAFFLPWSQPPWAPLPAAGMAVLAFASLAALGEAGRVFVPLAPFAWAWSLWQVAEFLAGWLRTVLDHQVQRAESLAAGRVQAQLYAFPDWESPQGFRCRGLLHPCFDAGGDYLEILPRPDGTLGFILGDIAGHGIGAALIGAMVKAHLVSLDLRKITDPGTMAEELNHILFRLAQKRPMTAVIGQLDPATGELTLCKMGHPNPFHLTAAGLAEVSSPGFPLGVRVKSRFTVQRFRLGPGDKLLIYTDGTYEARDWSNRVLGFQPWKEMAGEALRQPELRLSRIVEELRCRQGGRPFDDDIGLLLLEGPKTDSDDKEGLRSGLMDGSSCRADRHHSSKGASDEQR